ncbi:MAG: alpha-L-fucosidase [Bacteroidales bacterium]|nr:alpha-L-fucosidase [Bacteroidales bacterium]
MKKTLLIFACVIASLPLHAQTTYTPTAENLVEREAFQDAKFGIFLHWGLYAMLATGEWTMTNNNINYQEYQKLAGGFYPNSFDANEWAKAIKDAGAGYICFTSRHHEGFSMWNTQQSNYNIVKATPFGRDVVGELAKACADNDLRFHLYYSLVDWWREDAPRGRTGLGTGRVAEKEDYPAYFQFMKNQLTELLTNYGKIGCIWFDGYWDQDQNPSFEWNMKGLYDHIHSIQPACLVANNHHISPLEGEDFQLFERDLPGENNAGLSGQEISRLPLETCETMNGMWGYKITDQRYKSGKTLIHYLVGAAGRGANLLMNIGPQPDGRLPQTALERLKEMGQWLRKYGESIYGTRAGEVSPRPWGVTTRKGNKLYVHVLSLEDDALFVPVTAKVKSSICLNTNEKVKVTNVPGGIVISGLKQIPEEWDRIIVLDAETL